MSATRLESAQNASWRELLFLMPTRAPDWLKRFRQACEADATWEVHCRRIVAETYNSDGHARDGHARVGWYLLSRGGAQASLAWFEADRGLARMGWWTALRYAEALAELEQMTQAETVVDAVYREHPEACNGHALLGWRLRGRLGVEAALDRVARDMAAGRLSTGFARNHALLLAQAGHWPSAIARMEQAVATDAGLHDGFAQLGVLHVRAGRWAEAWALLARDLESGRLPESWYGQAALVLAHLGRFEEAAGLAEQVRATDPARLDVFAGLALIAHEAGEAALALRLLERDARDGRLTTARQVDLEFLSARLRGAGDAMTPPALAASMENMLRALSDAVLADREVTSALAPALRTVMATEAAPVGPSAALWHALGDAWAADTSWASWLCGVVRALEPDRRWQRPALYAASERRLADYGRRLAQARLDWEGAQRVYPAMAPEQRHQAARQALRIARDMAGRPCGVLGDRLAQYGGVRQLASEGRAHLRIIEIGSLFGGSCMLFLLAARDAGATAEVICIDPLQGYYGQPRDPLSGAEVTPETLLGNVARLGLDTAQVTLRRCLSSDPGAWAGLARESIDLLMIDGDHSRAGVLSDWRNLAPLLCPGGVVIFDDYSPEHPGVIEAVDEIRAGLQGWCYLGCLGTSAVFRRNPCPGYEWSDSA